VKTTEVQLFLDGCKLVGRLRIDRSWCNR